MRGHGPARLGPDQPQEFEDRRARTVDVGNPHLVLLGPDTASVDIAELGPKLEAAFPGGINVEWITVAPATARAELPRHLPASGSAGGRRNPRLRHGQRLGRGGRRSWGAVEPDGDLRVRNPGGVLTVSLGSGEEASTHLAGPVRKVADLDIHPGMFS